MTVRKPTAWLSSGFEVKRDAAREPDPDPTGRRFVDPGGGIGVSVFFHFEFCMTSVRKAKRSEIKWINERYDEVEFIHSNFENEIIAIAERDDQKIGLGRLVSINPYNLELGGMYVFQPFRGQGIARDIVQFLLGQVKSDQAIYCIPFEHLVPFYRSCGFDSCTESDRVPELLMKKFLWCKEKYTNPTALLKLCARS